MQASLKERAIEQLKIYLLITLYLWILLGSFTIYRRLIISEAGGSYLHYGISLIEALIIAKVILVGRMFGFSRRFDDRPLIVPVVYKTLLFGLLVIAFGFIEHLVRGWLHGEGWSGAQTALAALGTNELRARVLMMMIAFVPFFAFGEIVRVIGPREMSALYFSKRDALRESRPSV